MAGNLDSGLVTGLASLPLPHDSRRWRLSLNEIVLRKEGWPLFEALAEEDELRKDPPITRGVYVAQVLPLVSGWIEPSPLYWASRDGGWPQGTPRGAFPIHRTAPRGARRHGAPVLQIRVERRSWHPGDMVDLTQQ